MGHAAGTVSGWGFSLRRLRGDRHRLAVGGVLGAIMVLQLGAASGALAGLLAGGTDRAEMTMPHPPWIPEEMPLPTDATLAFALPTPAGDLATYVYVRRPVALVIIDLEGRLAAEGWIVIAEQAGVVWPDDHRFRVMRRGQTWTVHAEPSVGSPTETNVIYAPA